MTTAVYTETDIKRLSLGSWKAIFCEIDVTTYATGGVPLVAGAFGLTQIDHVQASTSELGYFFTYDRVNQKLRVLTSAGGGGFVDASDNTDVGTCLAIVYGI